MNEIGPVDAEERVHSRRFCPAQGRRFILGFRTQAEVLAALDELPVRNDGVSGRFGEFELHRVAIGLGNCPDEVRLGGCKGA